MFIIFLFRQGNNIASIKIIFFSIVLRCDVIVLTLRQWNLLTFDSFVTKERILILKLLNVLLRREKACSGKTDICDVRNCLLKEVVNTSAQTTSWSGISFDHPPACEEGFLFRTTTSAIERKKQKLKLSHAFH